MRQNKPVPAESIVEKDGRRYREVPVRSALPLWAAAAVWLLAALFLPMYSLWHLLLIAAVSAAAALLCARLLPKETRLVELPFCADNADLDAMARQTADAQQELIAAANAVAGAKPQTAALLREIAATCAQIRGAILASPGDLNRIRRFLNYYLPTTRKLAAKYTELCAQNAPGENITGTAAAIEEALAQINTSFHRQFDSLYADDALDITTDITVLDTLLARDGLK